MKEILEKYIEILNGLKAPVLTITFLIMIGYVLYQVFIGGQERRTVIGNVISFLAIATLVWGADKILAFIKAAVGG
jgi:hypothetical protein